MPETDSLKAESWKVGKWKVGSGKWKVGSGKWKVGSGKRKTNELDSEQYEKTPKRRFNMESIIGKRLVDVTVEEFLSVFTEVLKNAVMKEEEPVETDYYMTTEEVAEYLNIRPSYVYRLTHENRIPFSKANGTGKNLFRKSEIDEWVSNGRLKTVYEIEEEAKRKQCPKL